METKIENLLQQVARARQTLIQSTNGLTQAQAQFKPDAETWSVIDNVEHLVWAEWGGINGMWKTLEGVRMNNPVWTGVAIHEGLPIEKIVEQTWQPKEKVPEIAKPKWGGTLDFWTAALTSNQGLLTELVRAMEGMDLTKIIHPHPISGPLNVIQRLEFLSFHMNRHQKQIENLRALEVFPGI